MASELRVDGVLDIETESWTRFVVGEVLYSDGSVFVSRDEDELGAHLLERGGQIWSWNGGKYDSLWWLDWAVRNGVRVEVSLAGPRVTRARAGSLMLRDAVALVPMALDAALGIVGRRKAPVGLACVCGSHCGGYCAIRRVMPEASYRLVEEYLHEDCRGALDILEFIFAYAKEHDILLSGTVGGTSWKTAKRDCDLPDPEWLSLVQYRMAREGDFGGRVQLFQPLAPRGHQYDINAAYPAALATTTLPLGTPMVVSGSRAARAYALGREGVFHVAVHVPDMFLPPLPVRLRSGRVAYPTGLFRGAWTGVELRAAEDAGAQVQRFGSSIVWPDAAPIVAPYMERIWTLRDKAGKKTALGVWLKFVCNSFTGKVSQAPENRRAIVNPERSEIKVCLRERWCSEGCVGFKRCASHRWEMLGRSGRVYAAPVFRLADCSHVHWGAYLRAVTRVKWRQQALGGSDGVDMVYGDTDSVFAVQARSRDIGPELGSWLEEGIAFEDFRAIGPKAYSYIRVNADGSRVRVSRCKGLSDPSPENFERFWLGEQMIEERGVKSFMSAARADLGLFVRKRIIRTRKTGDILFGDRILRGKLTYPLDVASLRRYEDMGAWDGNHRPAGGCQSH